VLEETLVNTNQVLGIQPWISRAPAQPFFDPNQRIGANLGQRDKAEAIPGGSTRQAEHPQRLYKMVEHGEERGRPQGIGTVPECWFHGS
jgi:hypothetical protein